MNGARRKVMDTLPLPATRDFTNEQEYSRLYSNTVYGGGSVRIELEGTLLKMTPENDREKNELNQLWTIIIGCVEEGKKLVPVGQYIPGIKEVAVFNIE